MEPALRLEHVVVVGAGVSGAACAVALATAGVAVTVLDRARAPGGRMASPTQDGRRVDIGASYFTCADPDFSEVAERWQARGLARRWTDRFDVYANGVDGQGVDGLGVDGPVAGKPGPVRWAASSGLRSLVQDLLAQVVVRRNTTVERIEMDAGRLSVNGLAADRVVLAMPDPQAMPILQASPDLTDTVQAAPAPVQYDPMLAVTTTWRRREWPFLDGAFVNDHPILAFLADDGARRGDAAPVLVAHTTADFAREHLAEPDQALALVVPALARITGCSADPVSAQVHRWTFAKPSTTHDAAPYWLGESGVGLAGDSWCPQGSPRVEAAWLSGTRLAAGLLA